MCIAASLETHHVDDPKPRVGCRQRGVSRLRAVKVHLSIRNYTMTRLTSIEKGGYYAFPDEHLPALASLFAPSRQGGRLLDPCAGEGRALDHLARAWKLTPYANEIEDERAAQCKALFGQAQTVHSDMYQLKASNQAF